MFVTKATLKCSYYCCCCVLLVLSSLETMFSMASASESVLPLHVSLSEGEIVLGDGDDPCDRLREYCRSNERGPDCWDEAHAQILDVVWSNWEDVYTKLRVSPEFFIDCQPLLADDVAGDPADAATFQPSPVYELLQSLSGANTTAQVISEVLSLLDRFVLLGDQEALAVYDLMKYELVLSDKERLKLYSTAITVAPRHRFVVDELGLALIYTGQETRGRKLYENAVRQGIWPHVLQRPVETYHPGLDDKAWHDKSDYPFLARLEEGYSAIKQELLHNLRENWHLFGLEAENVNMPQGGQWRELRLKSRHNYTAMEEYFPVTVNLLKSSSADDDHREIINAKFSSIQPGTHIRLHTGPTNRWLRCHLTLIHDGGARLRVGDEWTTWEEGKAIVFDSSWEHEVVHEGDSIRVVLIVDIWHPGLPPELRI